MGLVLNAARVLRGELQSGKNCDLKCSDNDHCAHGSTNTKAPY